MFEEIDFNNVMNQSNPVFGEIAYVSDNKDMAMHGYITPMNLVYTRSKENEGWASYKEDIAERAKAFVESLMHIAEIHDKKIRKDSAGRRRGFLFVTVSGNRYLEAVRNSSKFLKWANENKVGVYMTSAETDRLDYTGEGRIKKATGKNWAKRSNGSETFKIEEFLDILNGRCDEDATYKEFELTAEETYNYMNILININQCNSGINLPALNGVYISKALDKDSPAAIQIPGRACRPDKDDQPKVGKIENCPANNPDHHGYVKPYGYIYTCLDEFTYDEYKNMKEVFELYYQDYFMVKTTLETRQAGAKKKPDEPDNNNKGEGKDLIEADSFNIRLFEDFQIDLLKATTSKTLEERLAWWDDVCEIAMNKLSDAELKNPNVYSEEFTEDEIEFCNAIVSDNDMKTDVNILKFANIFEERTKKYI